MDRTIFAPQPAPVAAAARPCGGFGLGYQWRDVAKHGVVSNRLMSIDATANATTKRTARRLGMATT
jgi:hypothetical protein